MTFYNIHHKIAIFSSSRIAQNYYTKQFPNAIIPSIVKPRGKSYKRKNVYYFLFNGSSIAINIKTKHISKINQNIWHMIQINKIEI